MLSLEQLQQARKLITPHLLRTPVLTNDRINQKLGETVYFKCENFQRVGAFKARGAAHAVLSLDEATAKRGVITHSSGNHGAALAWAAKLRGIQATVVVPENAPQIKKDGIASFGAKIVYCEATVPAREKAVNDLIAQHNLVLIHPYNDWRVIAGQASAMLELAEEAPPLDIVMTPVGGGGLLSGTVLAAKALFPNIKVYGGEPAGSDDAYRSLQSGQMVKEVYPKTICDGLRSTLGEITFSVLKQHLDAIVLATEERIIEAMRMIWENLKIIIEPSCCPPLAAILDGKLDVKGKTVGIILTGGNVDLQKLPWQ